LIKKIESSLFAKVLIVTAVLLAGMSFLVYAILAWYTPKTYSNNLNKALDEQTQKFILELSEVSMEQSGNLFDNFLDNQNVDKIELHTDDGRELEIPTMRDIADDFVVEESNDGWGNSEIYPAPIISNSYSISFLNEDAKYTLVVYGAAGQIVELQRAFGTVLPILAFIVVLVAVITSCCFSCLITKPVLEISQISEKMSDLHFEWQIDEHRKDELGILEKSLNTLSHNLSAALSDLQSANKKLELDIERERELEQARTDFFSAVSHELKTPITIIKGQLEGMLLGVGAYKDREKYLARSLEIANALEVMVQEILTISRLETAGADLKKECLDCFQIIKSYLSETEDLIVKKDLQIQLDIPSKIFINGNKMLMEKVFSNLIGNAIKYSPQGASIRILAFAEHQQWVFSIENTGTNIPEDSIPNIFEAFYRIDHSRSRKTGGSGLGLYVTQKILHQHGSECTVCNTQSGVKFSFTI